MEHLEAELTGTLQGIMHSATNTSPKPALRYTVLALDPPTLEPSKAHGEPKG